MSTDTLHTIVSLIENHTGKKARQSGQSFRTVCPGHDGTNYSLVLTDSEKRVMMHCHSHGCDPLVILESIGLSIKDVYYENLDPVQKQKVNERKLLEELLEELRIIALWAHAKIRGSYPGVDEDRFRVKRAKHRLIKALNYMDGEL
ncbi:MAG: hypothetical protein QNL62_19640 [Gammaproteobacteria bacterium]|nr:hypothetical protein [Gammaproteobacteria bacterium]